MQNQQDYVQAHYQEEKNKKTVEDLRKELDNKVKNYDEVKKNNDQLMLKLKEIEERNFKNKRSEDNEIFQCNEKIVIVGCWGSWVIKYGILFAKGESQYALIKKFHVSPGQITRLKRNESVSTNTIDMLCRILNCGTEDVLEYKEG